VLQAADILLYDTDEVPVGEDQVAARGADARHRRPLPPPLRRGVRAAKAVVPASGARVMGFDDPTVKMSKSWPTERRPRGAAARPTRRVRKTIMSA
jgi:tryptophanyl-tRNA synthetase